MSEDVAILVAHRLKQERIHLRADSFIADKIKCEAVREELDIKLDREKIIALLDENPRDSNAQRALPYLSKDEIKQYVLNDICPKIFLPHIDDQPFLAKYLISRAKWERYKDLANIVMPKIT